MMKYSRIHLNKLCEQIIILSTVISVIIIKSGHSLEWLGKTVRPRIEKQLE